MIKSRTVYSQGLDEKPKSVSYETNKNIQVPKMNFCKKCNSYLYLYEEKNTLQIINGKKQTNHVYTCPYVHVVCFLSFFLNIEFLIALDIFKAKMQTHAVTRFLLIE